MSAKTIQNAKTVGTKIPRLRNQQFLTFFETVTVSVPMANPASSPVRGCPLARGGM